MKRRFQTARAARLPLFILLLSQNRQTFYPGNLFVSASTGMDAQTLRSLGMTSSEIETILGTRNPLATSKPVTGTVERAPSSGSSAILGDNVYRDIKTNESHKDNDDYEYDEFVTEEDIFTILEENGVKVTDAGNNDKDSNEVIISSEFKKNRPFRDEAATEVERDAEDEIENNNVGTKKEDDEWWKDPFNRFDDTDDDDDDDDAIDDTEIKKIEEQSIYIEEFEDEDFADELLPEDEVLRAEEYIEEQKFATDISPVDEILKIEENFEEEYFADELPPEDEVLRTEEDFEEELFPEGKIPKMEEEFDEEDFADELLPEDEILQMEEEWVVEDFADELSPEDEILKKESKLATEGFANKVRSTKIKKDLDILDRKSSIHKSLTEDSSPYLKEEFEDLNNAILQDGILLEDDIVDKTLNPRSKVDEKMKFEIDPELDLDEKILFNDESPPKEDIIDVTKIFKDLEEVVFTDELTPEGDITNERAAKMKGLADDEYVLDDEYDEYDDEYEEYDNEDFFGIEDNYIEESEDAPNSQFLVDEIIAENTNEAKQNNVHTETLVEKENIEKVEKHPDTNNELQAVRTFPETNVKIDLPSKTNTTPLKSAQKTDEKEDISKAESALTEHNSLGKEQAVGSMGTDQDVLEDISEPPLNLVKDIKANKTSELKRELRNEKNRISNGIATIKKNNSLSLSRREKHLTSVNGPVTKDIEPMLSTLSSGSEEKKSKSLGGSTLPILILPKIGKSLMDSPLVVQFFAAASIGNIAIQQIGALLRRRKFILEDNGVSEINVDSAKSISDIEDAHEEYDQSDFVEVTGDYGFGRPRPQKRVESIDDVESEHDEEFDFVENTTENQALEKKNRIGVKLWGNSSNSKSEVIIENINSNDRSQELKMPKKRGRGRGFGFMGKQTLSYEYAIAMEQVEKMSLRVQKAESTRDQYEIDCDRAMQQLRELKKELSEVGKTNTYLKNQLADNKRILERAVNVERQKTNNELSRLREQMVEVLERERRMMRAQLMKSSAEVRALIGESMSDEYDFVDDYDVGDN
mmetsp:Transcript_17394/g.26278  ORF Transcript_17394/g.26278 Transcript_17394/m.26278 type:complete len:1041 (-) Transcript_17394:804-3926(-)